MHAFTCTLVHHPAGSVSQLECMQLLFFYTIYLCKWQLHAAEQFVLALYNFMDSLPEYWSAYSWQIRSIAILYIDTESGPFVELSTLATWVRCMICTCNTILFMETRAWKQTKVHCRTLDRELF